MRRGRCTARPAVESGKTARRPEDHAPLGDIDAQAPIAAPSEVALELRTLRRAVDRLDAFRRLPEPRALTRREDDKHGRAGDNAAIERSGFRINEFVAMESGRGAERGDRGR